MNFYKVILTITLLISTTLVNSSTITTYTDRALFNDNVGATTLETFGTPQYYISNIPNGVLNTNTDYDSISPGDIAAGATYSTPTNTGGSLNIDSSICACNEFEGGFLDGGYLTDTALTITYSSPVAYFGFDTNGTMSNFQVTINSASGIYLQFFNLDPNDGSMSFFGFQSDLADIQSVIINSNSNYSFAIDNHSFGAGSAAVPAPPAFLLFISGLISLLFTQKTRITNHSS